MGFDFDFIQYKQSSCLLFNKLIVRFLCFSFNNTSRKGAARKTEGFLHTTYVISQKQRATQQKNYGAMFFNSSFSKSRGVLLYHGPVVTRAHIGRTTLSLFNMVEPDASGKFSASVCLTEDDIPGAKLPKGSPEECNCWMLRRWLQCRGGRTTGKKTALVQR